MFHHLHNLLHLIMRDLSLAVTQDLCKAHDDIQRGTDLMGHVLDKECFLAVGIFSQLRGLHQFFITAFCLFIGTLDIIDMTVERLLHGCKAVLQLSDGILALGMRNLFLIIS